MKEKDDEIEDNPLTTWVLKSSQITPLINTLLEHGFKKLDPGIEAKKIWRDDYLWYYDDIGNYITIDSARNPKEHIVTCTQGAKPIVSDAFSGLDKFRKASGEDF